MPEYEGKIQKVLLVSGEDAFRTVLGAELEGEGYAVRTASTKAEALNMYKSDEPDLVLGDTHLSNMAEGDGFDLLKEIKEINPKTSYIVITGFAELKNALKSKKLGAEDFVSKPYDLIDLLTTMERVLYDAQLAKQEARQRAEQETVLGQISQK
ncbi:MAG: response regulator [Candidatus Aenigmarchaeota archaeon]|nr:response regulator [Candidatus Aenigmarchaeota archaeon]